MEIDDRWVKEGRSGRAGSIDRTNLASPLCPCSLVDLRIEISSIARFFSFFLAVACFIDGVRNLKNIIGGIAATLSVGSLPLIEAAPITPGNLVIYRVGTGSNALASTGNEVFLDEYTTAGSLVQSIAMPATGDGTKLVSAGNSNGEGALSISPDGTWLAFTGYNTTVPLGSSITAANSTTVPRVAGVFNTTTGTHTLTVMGTAFSASSPRGAVTSDGNKIWAVGGNTGVVYGTVDGTSPFVGSNTTVNSALIGTNLRTIGQYGDQLYVSSATGTLPTVGLLTDAFANGLPTASTPLPNIPRQGGSPVTSRYGFTFLDVDPTVVGIDTMYTVDDSATSGGLWKYTLDGNGTWTGAGSVTALTGALRGLTAGVDGSDVKLYMTGSANTLWSYTDTNAFTSTLSGTLSNFTSIATSASNTAFRGVALVGVPEPSTALLAGLGVLIAYVYSRRRKTS